MKEINDLEPGLQKLSDEELRDKTAHFKKRLQQGETLDDLLVDAFAVCPDFSTQIELEQTKLIAVSTKIRENCEGGLNAYEYFMVFTSTRRHCSTNNSPLTWLQTNVGCARSLQKGSGFEAIRRAAHWWHGIALSP